MRSPSLHHHLCVEPVYSPGASGHEERSHDPKSYRKKYNYCLCYCYELATSLAQEFTRCSCILTSISCYVVQQSITRHLPSTSNQNNSSRKNMRAVTRLACFIILHEPHVFCFHNHLMNYLFQNTFFLRLKHVDPYQMIIWLEVVIIMLGRPEVQKCSSSTGYEGAAAHLGLAHASRAKSTHQLRCGFAQRRAAGDWENGGWKPSIGY